MARVFTDGPSGSGPVSTLASAIAAGAVSAPVAAGEGGRFPATGDFSVRLEDAADSTIFEIVTCTARATDTLTISPTVSAWGAGTVVAHVIAKVDLDEFLQEGAAAATYQALSGYASGEVLAFQTTTSTSYTDLTTSGPAATVTIGVSGKALVFISANLANTADNGYALMSFAVSGATTLAASDNRRMNSRNFDNTPDKTEFPGAAVIPVSGLTPGSNTFTAKYALNGSGSAQFGERRLVVIAI